MLKVSEVECYYGAVKVLQEITLRAEKGEFFGIIGPNGSGKTTLLRCVGRVLKPKVGEIVLEEKEIYSMKAGEVATKVAVVSQQANTDFAFTALEVVMMGRTPHLGRFQVEGKKDLEIAKKAMKWTDTLHLSERLLNELSGGERQRVMIARALAQEPKLLLLDEPTANLDIGYQLEIMDMIKKLTEKEGLMVIVAIHDLNLAAQYCNRMAMMSHGKIISIGAPEEVLTPENIKKAFDVKVMVKRHDATSSIYISPVLIKTKTASRNFKIHIICGAGTGSSLMNSLLSSGYQISAGVLNVLDTDHETALSLGIPVVSEAPFSPITEQSHSANLQIINDADTVILTTPPFGSGNLLNLEAAKYALNKKIPVLIIKQPSVVKHEYYFKEAEERLEELKRVGAQEIQSSQLLKFIEGIESENRRICAE